MGDSRLIHGRYRLLDRIGRGGMGEVWRARDESLGRQVAVKCLKPIGPEHDRASGRVLRERFRREARVAASLQHPGITVVHDFGEADGVPYLVMELLQGRDLSRLLEDNKQHPLPVDEVVDIARQVASALAHTHDQGIVHRDLKPANIVRLTDGTVKICDFGIARLGHDLGSSRLTGTGIAMGTPHYMSPEQIGGSAVDRRSDLYSLGCVLYEIATGVPPFDLDDAWAVLVGHRDTPPPPPREHRAELPGHLERIILDLLAKEPGHRPDSAHDLADRLAEVSPRPDRAAVPRGRVTAAVAAAPSGPGVPDVPGGRGARLPSWTRGMTTGRMAAGAAPAPSSPDPAAALSGEWIARPAGLREEEPPADTRPAPPSRALTTLDGRHDAGLSLGRLGRWAEAGEVHRAVAAEREHLLGPEHPDTLASRHEVALSLSRTGRAADALREFQLVTGARRRVLGADHADTLASRQEKAHVLARTGRPLDAHQSYLAVLAARERTQGPDHPDTLRCRHDLAFNLGRLGRLEDAYTMARDVAEARARVLGAEHPDTLATRFEAAFTLSRLGRWEQALDIHREVAAARATALGADHPDTLAARHETAVGLGRLGRTAEALESYRALVADRTRAQGPDHPETLRTRHGLGVALGRLGRWEESLAEAREVCALRERVLGAEHADTLVSRREIAVALGWLDRWGEALAEYRQVADARERVLGAEHPDTLGARNDEAQCLQRLDRPGEAAELYRTVASLRQARVAGGP
ncbi:tetratricopeptide repeat protein [Streptomyces sp. enrichment culture]|uniref:serine/threonine-protein kinase n=1 Tax=Streptomyces sp. enrichment culture TaxID=1795815 RepID=UPI003F54EB0F